MSVSVKVKKKQSHYRPVQALRVQEVEASRFLDNRHMKVASCQPYAPAAFTPKDIFLVLISVGG
jgi:hypothetical protein